MGESENKGLLHRYMNEVWQQGDLAALDRFLHASFRRHMSPTTPPLDRGEQIQRLRGFRDAFPDIAVELQDVVAAGDLVSFRSIMSGTHQGEFLGLAATGRHVTVQLVDLWRVTDGRVVEQWGGPDMFDLVRQLGATFAESS